MEQVKDFSDWSIDKEYELMKAGEFKDDKRLSIRTADLARAVSKASF